MEIVKALLETAGTQRSRHAQSTSGQPSGFDWTLGALLSRIYYGQHMGCSTKNQLKLIFPAENLK